MDTSLLILFIALAFIAEVLGTIGGFGSSLFFVPIAGYFFDFHSVLGITALFHISSNLTKIYFFRKGVDWNLILKIGIPSVLFVIIGAYFSKHVESKYLEISLGVFLILFSTLLLLFKSWEIKTNTVSSVLGGGVSGFLAGLLGTGGAIRGLIMSAYNLKMEIFIATSAIIDLAIDGSRAIVYSINGYVHQHDLFLIPILLVVSIIGTFVGKVILKKISEENFKMIVLLLILVTGIVTLVKFLFL